MRGTAGAEVRVDNEVLGKTPLETSLTLVAGHHAVDLRRPGYSPAHREVDVGEGATGEIQVDLAVDPSQLGTEGATLALDVSEAGADLTVDGEHKGVYREPLRLPRGPHHLTVMAAGFIPVEPQRRSRLRADQRRPRPARATPEKRAQVMSNARFHKTWGWIGVASGAVLAGGGRRARRDRVVAAERRLEDDRRLEPQRGQQQAALRSQVGLRCRGRTAAGQDGSYLCDKGFSDAQNKYSSAKGLITGGYVGIGVGGALLVTGVVLLLTGEDSDRFDHPETHSLGRKSQGPSFAVVPGPASSGRASGSRSEQRQGFRHAATGGMRAADPASPESEENRLICVIPEPSSRLWPSAPPRRCARSPSARRG